MHIFKKKERIGGGTFFYLLGAHNTGKMPLAIHSYIKDILVDTEPSWIKIGRKAPKIHFKRDILC